MKLGGSEGYTPPDAGKHRLRLVSIIDVGTHPPGNPKFRARRQIRLGYILPDVLEEIENNGVTKTEPKTYSEIFAAALWSNKGLTKLGKRVKGITGKDPQTDPVAQDTSNWIGVDLEAHFAPNEDDEVVLTSAKRVAPFTDVPKSETFEFSWDEQKTTEDALEALSSLSEGMVKWLCKAREFALLPGVAGAPGSSGSDSDSLDDNDTPF